MPRDLTIAELKRRGQDFVDLIGNEHDTTSDKIVGLLDEAFAVQHGGLAPSLGGREAFLNNLKRRLEFAQGKVNVEVKNVIAELADGTEEEHGGWCWIYSRKNTPLGSTDSVSLMK